MERREADAFADGRGHAALGDQLAAARGDLHEVPVLDPRALRVGHVDLDDRLGRARAQRGGLPGARQRVPVIAHAACREGQRKHAVGELGGLGVGDGHEARAAVGRRKDAVAVEPGGAGMLGRGRRPLHGARAQPRVAQPRVVAGPPGRQRRELVEDLRRALVREPGLEAHRGRDARDDLGVGQRLARRWDEPRQVRQPALGARHDAVLLGPLRGRQQDVGEGGRLGRMVGVLDDHQLGLAQRPLHDVRVGHGRRRVRAHDPHGARVVSVG